MVYWSLSTKAKPEDLPLPLNASSSDQSATPSNPGAKSLAAVWASKYVKAIATSRSSQDLSQTSQTKVGVEGMGRSDVANKILRHLNRASALGWSLTEALLADEIPRHGIAPELVDPWEISAEVHRLYTQVFQAYADGETPQRLSVLLGAEFGRVRQKYTTTDPRVIGFVSMQFHYTGQQLLERLSTPEQGLVSPYLKVMDDLYMPLRDTYEAAATHDLDSPSLIAVQHLLPVSTAIAKSVCDLVIRFYPDYKTYSGSLRSPQVKTSSIRDVEMFQVYLCLCVLEDSIRSFQQQLFPLCVMLYPQLNVQWELVQDMLKVLRWEMYDRLDSKAVQIFLPHLLALTEMFSPEVFQNSLPDVGRGLEKG